MINFYIGLMTGLLVVILCISIIIKLDYKILQSVVNKPIKRIESKIEPIKPDIETAVNNIMEYNEDVALQAIKKQRG